MKPVILHCCKSVLFLLLILHGTIVHAQQHLDVTELEADKYDFLNRTSATSAINNNGANIDEKYVRFNITMDPSIAVATIKGSVTHYFTTKLANVQTIKYDLYNVGMDVDSIYYHGIKYTTSEYVNHVVDTVIINLPAPIININTLDSVTIFYRGTPPQSGNSRGYKKALISNKFILSTHSSGYFARQWWPCKHTLGDKIDSVDFFIRTPDTTMAVANGLLKTPSPSSVAGYKTWWWQTKYPVAHYLIAIAVYPYTVHNSPSALVGATSVPIVNYLTAGTNTANGRTSCDKMKDVMEYFNTVYGEYPFKNEKYGHVVYTFGGGMENQTGSFVGTGLFDNTATDLSILAHELAHQWWGDQVTCDSWGNIWVNEGFARNSEVLYSEQFESLSLANTKRSNHKTSSKSTSGTVYRYDTEVVTEADHLGKIFVGSMVYDKASIIISMLRKLVGEANFKTAMKNYLADPAISYGNAATEDVKRHFEAVSGLDLTSFFDDFIYKSGYPVYTVNWGASISAPYQTAISYNQAQTQTGVYGTVSYYNTVLPVHLKNTSLSRDTVVYIFDQPYLENSAIFFNTSFPVTSIDIDPYAEAYTFDWTINGRNNAILPVNLLTFKASKQEDAVALEWFANAYQNFSHFVVEKSKDGLQFESIGTVPGNPNAKSYRLNDLFPNPGKNYYRLQMVDKDGVTKYSHTVQVLFNQLVKNVTVGPNPAIGSLNIYFGKIMNALVQIQLVNHQGQVVHAVSSKMEGMSNLSVDVHSIPSGSYWLEIVESGGKKWVQQVIIKH